jgi:transposase-like protein
LWEAKYAPLLTDELKADRKGQVTTRWKADETMIRVKQKLFYLYRAIDSQGKLVNVRLSEVRDTESTAAFFEQAVETTGQKPEQITSDKDTTYPPAIEKVLGRKVEHRNSRYLNNRMERATRNQLLTISEKLKEVRPTTVRFRFAPTNLMARSVASGRAA